MARPLRIEYCGAVYHVTSRGNAREAIFTDDKDRRTFLAILSKVVKRHHWLCHAYCLMDNHYHLLIETPDSNLSRGMRQLNGLYTQTFNRLHGRVGHVLQGRFKGILVDKDNYLLELCRYIALNPVRAKMVTNPKDYFWSSYCATVGLSATPTFLTRDWLLTQFSTEEEVAVRRFKEFVEGVVKVASPWNKLTGQIVLGSASFVKKAMRQLKEVQLVREFPRCQRFVARPDLKALFPEGSFKDKVARDKTIYKAH